jgi:hypothetical protein
MRIAAQLVAKHPALATIPPNVVITRVKSISMALGMSMQVRLGAAGTCRLAEICEFLSVGYA